MFRHLVLVNKCKAIKVELHFINFLTFQSIFHLFSKPSKPRGGGIYFSVAQKILICKAKLNEPFS